jgi:hypothetical protein
MPNAVDGLRRLRRIGQKAGPYIVLEMLLPGGTLFALLLFLYRRRPFGIGWRALALEPQRSTTTGTGS